MVRLMEYLSCFTKLSIHLITCICGNKNDFKAKIGSNYRIQGHSGPAYANWLESFVERGR